MLGGMPAPFHPAFGVVSPDPNVPLSAEYLGRLQEIAAWWAQPAPDRARQMMTGTLPIRAPGPDQSILSVFHVANLIAQLHFIAPITATKDVGQAFQTVIDALNTQEQMYHAVQHQPREIAVQQSIESPQFCFRIVPEESYQRLRARRPRRRVSAAADEAPAATEAAPPAAEAAPVGAEGAAAAPMDVSELEGEAREHPAPTPEQVAALYATPLGAATIGPASPRPSDVPTEHRYPRRTPAPAYTDVEDTASEGTHFDEYDQPEPRAKAVRFA